MSKEHREPACAIVIGFTSHRKGNAMEAEEETTDEKLDDMRSEEGMDETPNGNTAEEPERSADGESEEGDSEEDESINSNAGDEPIDSDAGRSSVRGLSAIRDRVTEWLKVGNRSISVIASTSAVLMFALAICISMNISQGERLNIANAGMSELSEETSALEERNETLKDGNKQLRDRIAELNGKAGDLEAELNNYKDQQATIDDMSKKLEEVHSSYDKLLEERDGLQGQLDAKRLAEEQAARAQAEAIQQQQSSGGYGGTVYWVSGGSVYHLSPNCVTLKRSNGIMSGPKSSCPRTRCCSVCG